jgi:hypothetical protein
MEVIMKDRLIVKGVFVLPNGFDFSRTSHENHIDKSKIVAIQVRKYEEDSLTDVYILLTDGYIFKVDTSYHEDYYRLIEDITQHNE